MSVRHYMRTLEQSAPPWIELGWMPVARSFPLSTSEPELLLEWLGDDPKLPETVE